MEVELRLGKKTSLSESDTALLFILLNEFEELKLKSTLKDGLDDMIFESTRDC